MPETTPSTPPSTPASPLFAGPQPERSFPTAAVAIAVTALLILSAVLVLLGRRHGGSGESAAYAPHVQLGNLAMSESESLSGGKSTFIDGHITNRGPLTVTGATVLVAFPTDQGTAPQTVSVPVRLIRMREPYVDVQPIRAAPLAPGAEADFRLIFEGVSDAWNQQQPSLRITGVSTR